MSDFSSGEEQTKSFGTLYATLTLILFPPLCILTIPAIIFTTKAKELYIKGDLEQSDALSKKAKRYTTAAWAIAFIILLTALALYSISRLSLI